MAAKVNFTQLKTDADNMIQKLSEYHEQISGMLNGQKSRGLATVESAIRNAVDHLDRLPDAIEKAQFTSSKDVSKSKSRLTKPAATKPLRTATK
ncbi:hypothetical protein LCGC14_2501260 [marine sediment metagenome]|uniref:Uncharacterized protein n=1 Tax=marine sediment metagenome TaxID=412755 RepID=A0A0F9B2K6_9ZZZZ